MSNRNRNLTSCYVTRSEWMTGSERSGCNVLPGGHIVTTLWYETIVIVIICASLNKRDRDIGGQGMLGDCWLYRPLDIFYSKCVGRPPSLLTNNSRHKVHTFHMLLEGLLLLLVLVFCVSLTCIGLGNGYRGYADMNAAIVWNTAASLF